MLQRRGHSGERGAQGRPSVPTVPSCLSPSPSPCRVPRISSDPLSPHHHLTLPARPFPPRLQGGLPRWEFFYGDQPRAETFFADPVNPSQEMRPVFQQIAEAEKLAGKGEVILSFEAHKIVAKDVHARPANAEETVWRLGDLVDATQAPVPGVAPPIVPVELVRLGHSSMSGAVTERDSLL